MLLDFYPGKVSGVVEIQRFFNKEKKAQKRLEKKTEM